MPKAQIDGLETRYELKGSGPPLVMIMGLSGNLDWWGPDTIEPLSKDFTLLLFDNRDAGQTRTLGPPAQYCIRDMAEDTVGLMNHVGLDRPHILGLSMGGMVAQELVLAHPDRVDRLVLGCTTPSSSRGVAPAPEVLAEMIAPREGLTLADLADRLIKVLFTPEWVEANQSRMPELLERLSRDPIRPDAYVRQLTAISGFDALDRLAEISRPTLVVHGDRDILLPAENGRILAREIPGARLEVFEGAAHGLNVEQPERFVRLVREFLLG